MANDYSFIDNWSLKAQIDGGGYFSENSQRFDAPRLKSSADAATFNDFIKLIDQIVTLTNEGRERPIKFISYGDWEKSKDIELPIVTYRIYHRKPLEVKPRLRQTINDPENMSKVISVLGQKFEYTIEFSIIGSSDYLANSTLDEFEDIILTYIGFFKSQGVSDIRFFEQVPVEQVTMREDFYVERLRYYVTLEKITLASETKIQKIISQISVD